MSQELAIPSAPSAALATRPRGLQLVTLNDMWQFAEIVWNSGTKPKGFTKLEDLFLAIEMGAELGMPAMMALQNIGVINGKPAPYGDAVVALVYNSGLCAELDEYYEWDGARTIDLPEGPATTWPDNFGAVCVCRREGKQAQRIVKFTVGMARRGSLLAKSGPWTSSPERMLKFRASSFALRDEFADVLKGFVPYEELSDYPEEAPTSRPKAPAFAPPPVAEEVSEGVVEEAPVAPEKAGQELVDEYNALRESLFGRGCGESMPDMKPNMRASVVRTGIAKLNALLNDERYMTEEELNQKRYPVAAAVQANKKSDPEGEAHFSHDEQGVEVAPQQDNPNAPTEQQTRAIPAIGAQLFGRKNRDEEILKLVQQMFGEEATTETLTKAQSSKLIDTLKTGLDAQRKDAMKENVPEPTEEGELLATEAQMKMLHGIAGEIWGKKEAHEKLREYLDVTTLANLPEQTFSDGLAALTSKLETMKAAGGGA